MPETRCVPPKARAQRVKFLIYEARSRRHHPARLIFHFLRSKGTGYAHRSGKQQACKQQVGGHQAGGQQVEGQQAGRLAGATIGALLLLRGCASFHKYQMSRPTSAKDKWLTTENADAVVQAMAAKGMMPETIDCRFADTTPGQLAYLSKFTWKRAPQNTRYHWEVGDPAYLSSNAVKANRVGLRRVSAKTVTDPATGQTVGCSIWAG